MPRGAKKNTIAALFVGGHFNWQSAPFHDRPSEGTCR